MTIERYFLVKISIFHLNDFFNQLLVKNYLVSEEFKMRNLISKSKHLKDLIVNHTTEVQINKECSRMLFRAKYKDISKSFIEVISIWDKKKYYKSFFKKTKGRLFFKELKRQGFQACITEKYIDDSFTKTLIKKLEDNFDNSRIDFNKLGV